MSRNHSDDQSIVFDEAVEAASQFIKRALPPGRYKVFAFPPDNDLSPSAIKHRTRTRKEYEHFRKRLAATLRRQGSLPPNLCKVAADILEGKRPRFKKQADRYMTMVIGMAVEQAFEFLPTATRNEATKQQVSAFDAVARAATRNGYGMNYDNVAYRYNQFRKLSKNQ